LQLPESNISDEEVHALAALLRNNMSIDELNLRGNNISDDGARALAAVLSGRSGLRLVDLRGNKIGKSAIRIIAEALERSERVRHVYVHAGGKIEALGTGKWAKTRTTTTLSKTDMSMDDERDDGNSAKQTMNVETVCVVDIRDNTPAKSAMPFDPEMADFTLSDSMAASSSAKTFAPANMLESSGAPPRSSHGTRSEPKLLTNADSNKALASSMSNAYVGNTSPSKNEVKKTKVKVSCDRLL
jgi:hypothetical protein